MSPPNAPACLLLVHLLLLPISHADGAEPLITDRPDFTESAQTIPRGRLQLEGGYTFSRVGGQKAHTIGELLLRVGATERIELRIGINSLVFLRNRVQDESGAGDGSLGLKIKPFKGDGKDGKAIPEFAMILSTSLPTGSEEFREETLQPALVFSLAWDLTERLAMGSNLNFARPSENEEGFNQFSGSLTFALGLSERAGTYLEFYGFAPDSRDGPNSNFINGGLTYLVSDDHQLDLRVGVGLNEEEPDYFIGMGASQRW